MLAEVTVGKFNNKICTQDDVYACILVVLHILFPMPFDSFRANHISAGRTLTQEIKDVLDLWKHLQDSKVWRPFVEAADKCNYERMKEMADVFCHF
jgi:hypothetical protein